MRFSFPDDEPVESIVDELRRHGWSLGDAKFGDTWMVSGTNGENVILARGGTVEEAWRQAAEQARSFGFARPRGARPEVN
jgi:hypothetical protein